MGAFTGTLDFSTHNDNVTLPLGFNGSGSGTRTLRLGNGAWAVSNLAGGNAWTMLTTTNLTFAANSSTITVNGSPASAINFSGGGLAYNAVTINDGKGGVSIIGANTFATLTLTAPTTAIFNTNTTYTVTNLVLSGQDRSNPIGIFGSSPAATTQGTISSANSPTLSCVAVRNMVLTGGGNFAATNCLDLGFNTGLTCTAPPAPSGRIIGG